ncbi:MAG: A/G-specific adenine glycosylase [Burkholderiaceae bacterium]
MASAATTADFHFATAVTEWQAEHGRHCLPWQATRDPYRVWLSEIMLQQTQVVTVLGYFDRFLDRFPNVQSLAAAEQADVLALWSGLGYYSRARNLHRCAQAIVADHGGQFPRSASALQTLPGIGPSTAAAIASFCFHEPVSIYDGNVKRVLSRFLGFEGDLSVLANDKQLQQLAQTLVPTTNLGVAMPRYTQGLMDLGATVCTRSKPTCLVCPLLQTCVAQGSGNPTRLPVKTRSPQRSTVAWHLLLLQLPSGEVWLEKRPDKGIWAAMHCPPVLASEAELLAHPALAHATAVQRLAPFTHSLTHRDLVLHPVVCQVPLIPFKLSDGEAGSGTWVATASLQHLGLPAPISKLLAQLEPVAKG